MLTLIAAPAYARWQQLVLVLPYERSLVGSTHFFALQAQLQSLVCGLP